MKKWKNMRKINENEKMKKNEKTDKTLTRRAKHHNSVANLMQFYEGPKFMNLSGADPNNKCQLFTSYMHSTVSFQFCSHDSEH